MSHNGLLLWLLFLLSSSGASQTASEWQRHYGPPEAERFTVRDGISLTAFYSLDGQTCQVIIEAATSQPPNIFEEILAEVIPVPDRGKQEGAIGLGSMGGGISSIRYEHVRITKTSEIKDKKRFIQSATVDWNGIKCRATKPITAASNDSH